MKFATSDSSKPSHFKKVDIFFCLLFVASLGLTVWGINIYHLTIIDTKYLVVTIATGTIIAFATITLFFKLSYSKSWTFIQSVVIGGGTTFFAFLYLNQAFADQTIAKKDFQIIRTGTLGRGGKSSCFQPYAVIDFNGTIKQLIFYCDFEKTIKNYSRVSITFSSGLLGFDIIRSKQLTQ